MVPVMTSGTGGQPERLISGLVGITPAVIRSPTPVAALGLGCAAGMPPKVAQVPRATTSAAPSTASRRVARLELPATVDHHSVAPEGSEPSTTSTYLPKLAAWDASRTAS